MLYVKCSCFELFVVERSKFIRSRERAGYGSARGSVKVKYK
jgi:hypothetical protein